MGIDPPPAYFDHLTFNLDIKKGVNFASGAGGILDESGYNYVCLLCFLTGMIPHHVHKSTIKTKQAVCDVFIIKE